MNITVLLGNGFDLNYNLKTAYSDFYKYYISKESKVAIINIVKNDIKENIVNWSDLEFKLGEIANKFSDDDKGVDEYFLVYNDISDSLADYIEAQDSKLVDLPSSTDFVARIINIHNYLNNQVNLTLFNLPISTSIINIDFIVFNYTHTLEKILRTNTTTSIGAYLPNMEYVTTHSNIFHIHGFHDNRMIFGVNDKTQINNETLANNDLIATSLIKGAANKNSPGEDNELRYSSIIKKSDLIIIFGMSIGATDQARWRVIINELLIRENLRVIIFMQGDKKILRRPYQPCKQREDVYKKFFLASNLPAESKQKVKKTNCNLFFFKNF